MTHSLKYPCDVVARFLEKEALDSSILEKLSRAAPVRGPAKSVLERLVETMLFASMATEEGRFESVGIIFAEAMDTFNSQQAYWDIVTIASSGSFTVGEIMKLAAICDFPRSLLAVVLEGDELKIVGAVTPHSRFSSDADDLVRVLAPRPGVISVCRGENEVVRYERGTITEFPPRYYSSQWKSIAATVLGEPKPMTLSHVQAESNLWREIQRLVSAMSNLGHGGIIAVLGPDDEQEQHLLDARILKTPIKYGKAISEWQGLALKAKTRNEPALQDAVSRLDRMRQQIMRLTAVDGAVLLSHSLDVLAFGVKLHPVQDPSLEAYEMTGRGDPTTKWPLEKRGTRHRAAASFAKEHSKRLAFIVSQDGGTAVFQFVGSKLVYWRLPIPSALGSK